MPKKKKPTITTVAHPLASNPFAALSKLRDALPEGEPATPGNSVTVSEPSPSAAKRPSRAVVRYQRKGRGGKEVTLVEQLGLADQELSAWLRELKKALGCGGHVEEPHLVFAGDQRDRLPDLLRKRGVGAITVC